MIVWFAINNWPNLHILRQISVGFPRVIWIRRNHPYHSDDLKKTTFGNVSRNVGRYGPFSKVVKYGLTKNVLYFVQQYYTCIINIRFLARCIGDYWGRVYLLKFSARDCVRVSARAFSLTLINSPILSIKTKYTCDYVYQQKMYTLHVQAKTNSLNFICINNK